MEILYVSIGLGLFAALVFWHRSRKKGEDPYSAWKNGLERNFEANQEKIEREIAVFDGTRTSIESGEHVRIPLGSTLEGDITARVVEVEGRVYGNIRASEKIIVRQTATVEGDSVAAPKVIIDQGAVFRSAIDLGHPPASAGTDEETP